MDRLSCFSNESSLDSDSKSTARWCGSATCCTLRSIAMSARAHGGEGGPFRELLLAGSEEEEKGGLGWLSGMYYVGSRLQLCLRAVLLQGA